MGTGVLSESEDILFWVCNGVFNSYCIWCVMRSCCGRNKFVKTKKCSDGWMRGYDEIQIRIRTKKLCLGLTRLQPRDLMIGQIPMYSQQTRLIILKCKDLVVPIKGIITPPIFLFPCLTDIEFKSIRSGRIHLINGKSHTIPRISMSHSTKIVQRCNRTKGSASIWETPSMDVQSTRCW